MHSGQVKNISYYNIFLPYIFFFFEKLKYYLENK